MRKKEKTMSTGGNGAGAGGGARPPPRIDGMVSLKASTILESTATQTDKMAAGDFCLVG